MLAAPLPHLVRVHNLDVPLSWAVNLRDYKVASHSRLTRRAYFNFLISVLRRGLVKLSAEERWAARCVLYGARIARALRLWVLRRKVARIHRIARQFLAR